MAKSDKPAVAKPIFDVAHPGESAPSGNSKSVIISNRPLLKDPMMASTTVDNSAADAAANDNTDQPALAETANKSEPTLAEPTKATAADEPAKPAIGPTNTVQATDEADNKPTEEPANADDAKAKQSKAAEQAKAEDDEATKHQAATAKLADTKQYYLPINTVEKRRSQRFVILGILLSLLLIVAWADIALDAGLIHIGSLKSPTHFFSN